jgi:hypothetical protein
MDYKETLEDILELDESGIVVVGGYGDLVLDESSTQSIQSRYPNLTFRFKDFKELKESIWIKFGRADIDQVVGSLMDCNEHQLGDESIEGEYSFDMIFKWVPGEYHEHHLISPGYLDLRYTNWKFIQTFEQREREVKLNSLLDLDDLF